MYHFAVTPLHEAHLTSSPYFVRVHCDTVHLLCTLCTVGDAMLLQMTASALVCPGMLAPAPLLLASITCGIQTQDYSPGESQLLFTTFVLRVQV